MAKRSRPRRRAVARPPGRGREARGPRVPPVDRPSGGRQGGAVGGAARARHGRPGLPLANVHAGQEGGPRRGEPGRAIMFIGEAPGAEEEVQGEPFVGPAGQLLNRMIAGMGFPAADVYIGNIMNWRPELPVGSGRGPVGQPPADAGRRWPTACRTCGRRSRSSSPRSWWRSARRPRRGCSGRDFPGPGRGPRAVARVRGQAAHGHLPPELHPAQPDQPLEAAHLGGFAQGHGAGRPSDIGEAGRISWEMNRTMTGHFTESVRPIRLPSWPGILGSPGLRRARAADECSTSRSCARAPRRSPKRPTMQAPAAFPTGSSSSTTTSTGTSASPGESLVAPRAPALQAAVLPPRLHVRPDRADQRARRRATCEPIAFEKRFFDYGHNTVGPLPAVDRLRGL